MGLFLTGKYMLFFFVGIASTWLLRLVSIAAYFESFFKLKS